VPPPPPMPPLPTPGEGAACGACEGGSSGSRTILIELYCTLIRRRLVCRSADFVERLAQDAGFFGPHRLGALVGLVFVAQKVQDPVHQEKRHLFGGVPSPRGGLPRRCVHRDHHVAQDGRVPAQVGACVLLRPRQNICRLVDTAPLAVEFPNPRVIRKDDADLGVLPTGVRE